MQYDNDPFGLLEATRAHRDAIRENTGRTARCMATYTTVGVGETRLDKGIPFDITFIEEPCFTYGYALDDDSVDLVAGHYPRVGCGVYEWIRDNRGFYTGALLFFTVDTVGPGDTVGHEPNYTIHHHLRWEGTAIKDIPVHLLDL